MNLITLVVEIDDCDMGSLPDIINSANVIEWAWGNAIDEAAALRGKIIDLLNSRYGVQDDGLN